MKRLVIITVGKTHSGKTTFAKELEKELPNSFIMDQDNQAEFINTHYEKLQPTEGSNILKHGLSKFIVDYAKEHTNLHLIICNSNRSKNGRFYLLNEVFPQNEYIRILVHFDIPDDVLYERVARSTRNTNIFRGGYSSFKEVLDRQQTELLHDDVVDPIENEADYLFVIRNSKDVNSTILKIVHLAKEFSPTPK
ncbi:MULTISPECIES: ATP-binding protein [Bacillus cereus group]|uniref:ATP-binding protein n=1 Tax=Bacillus cereus group TaxID=86661 RepID=UPI0007FB4B06|nr:MULTISPECIES: ATP-binding protein [Bacillus cereus group]MCP1393769.1 tRNA uridine 5-carbamoylmethylation protein Kti12 [Bacillus cereus]MED3681499.1 ATP-binding protein [Bacillus thuringiensis]OBW87482.1 CRISPR-associated protein Cas2 [Bacillus cereus]PER60079.1 ATP-binding protein [Bacillus thuringiensis]PES55790.1 ATP-binding protein [Bacillus thuringiensis]